MREKQGGRGTCGWQRVRLSELAVIACLFATVTRPPHPPFWPGRGLGLTLLRSRSPHRRLGRGARDGTRRTSCGAHSPRLTSPCCSPAPSYDVSSPGKPVALYVLWMAACLPSRLRARSVRTSWRPCVQSAEVRRPVPRRAPAGKGPGPLAVG
ncbi:hypothetical protein SSBG_02831 [Streptomyces sp. SPB074]|nr:hypothetical protein SSBG_02831 [Streptomyces sp. SPB074]